LFWSVRGRTSKMPTYPICQLAPISPIQYLPKVWERVRARERTLWNLAFFSAIRKIQFSSDRDDFFLAVTIV
jgi:hypothetical protein